MADLGLTKAIARAVRKGTTGAKVLRPGEVAPERPPTAGLEPAVVPDPVVAPVALAPEPVVSPAADTPPTSPVAVTPPQRSFDEVAEEVAAERLSKARLGDYALDASHMPNFDRITSADDVKAVIAEMAERNKASVDEARRGVIADEEMRGLAEDLDVDVEVIRPVLARETGGTFSPEITRATRQWLNSSGDRIKELSDKIVSGNATDLDRILFVRQQQLHAAVYDQFMGARAEWGRTGRVFNAPVAGMSPSQLNRMRELISNSGTDIDRLAAAISQTDSLAGITNISRKYSQSKVTGVTNELFINGILSGLRTHIVNTDGNALFQAMNIFETGLAARVGKFLGGEEHVAVGEASAMLHGTLSAFRDGLRLAGRTMRTGKTLDDTLKYENTTAKAISAENLLSPENRNTPLGHAVDVLGAVVRFPTERLMASADEFFKTLAYRAELERNTFLHVQDQVTSGAARAEDAARVAREFMENAPLSAQQAADDYSRYVTFQNPLDSVGRKWQTALRSMPVLTLIAPFIRTPINLFKAGLFERSPLALFSHKFHEAIKKGGRDRDVALARVGFGSLTSATVAWQTMNGNISGGGPVDTQARLLLEQTGWRPYSIRNPVTGTYHSYARLEPWSSVVGATADITEIAMFLSEDTDTLRDSAQLINDGAAAVIAGITNNTLNKTFMKGLSDFTEMLNDPQRYASNWLGEFGTAIMPYSALRRQISQWNDPYMREAWTFVDRLKVGSGIPGYSENAPPRRDIFAQPRKHRAGSLLGTMSPMPDSEETGDGVADRLVLLMQQTRQVPVTMPGKKVLGLRLDANEYDQLVRIARGEPIFGGRTFRQELQRVMVSPVYALATPHGRVEIIKSIANNADDIGRIELEKRNPSFAARLKRYELKQDRLRFGQ